jgi:hypothetical protein
MKKFTIFLKNGSTVMVLAKRYRKEGDQYVFDRDEPNEDVQFILAADVKGILEGEFTKSQE